MTLEHSNLTIIIENATMTDDDWGALHGDDRRLRSRRICISARLVHGGSLEGRRLSASALACVRPGPRDLPRCIRPRCPHVGLLPSHAYASGRGANLHKWRTTHRRRFDQVSLSFLAVRSRWGLQRNSLLQRTDPVRRQSARLPGRGTPFHPLIIQQHRLISKDACQS